MGYARAQSTASLVSGVVFGLSLVVSGWALLQGDLSAAYVAVALAILLTGFFWIRFFRTGRWLPAGVMMILSLLALIFLVLPIV